LAGGLLALGKPGPLTPINAQTCSRCVSGITCAGGYYKGYGGCAVVNNQCSTLGGACSTL
jgi:hypothetical protein